MEKKRNYFNKIQSDYLFTYLLSFFNLSDIRSIFPLSKRFVSILNKDNKKIIRDIQNKIFSIETDNKLVLNPKNIKITSFCFNRAPILNAILADHLLIASSYQFDPGFSVFDLKINKLSQKILFKEKNYSYVNSMMYIKDKKIVLIGTNNGYIVGYSLNKDNLKEFYEYKTGLNKEIKNFIYYKFKEQYIIITLESDESINLNFLRIFNIKSTKEKYEEDKYEIFYIKSYIIKNVLIYNIKLFENNNDKFMCLGINEGNISFNENNKNNIFKKDKVMKNELGIININKIKIWLNDYKKNYEYLLSNKTCEELHFDFKLKGHKSFITDYLYLKENNIILSVEYLSPYLFFWDTNTKLKIKSILLPHTDSILCLLNISNKYISSSGRDRKIFIYSIKDLLKENSIINNKEIKCNHSSDIFKINYYKESNINRIISASFDKTIKIFSYKNDNLDKMSKIILTGHSTSISCVKVDLLRKQIITIDINCIINIWEYNESYKIYIIIKSIEMNLVNRKKEYVDDFIFLYDNYNSIIKIDRTKKIKIFSLSKEEFSYEYSENENIIKILDFCNFSDFICYTSKNEIKIYNYRIKKKENVINYEINKIKDININDNIINNQRGKMTCFEMLSWKYKIIGIAYNNKKIVIIKFNIELNNEQYCIDLNQDLNGFNNNVNINQIKCIEHTNKNTKSKNNVEFALYVIFPIDNIFFIYNLISDFFILKINLTKKIIFEHDINYFDYLNKYMIISSFYNHNKIEIIYLPDYEKEEKKEALVDIMEISNDYFNKMIYINDKGGLFFISNDLINYVEI